MTENCCFRFILQSREKINNLLTDKQKTVDEKIKELEVRVPAPSQLAVHVCGFLTVAARLWSLAAEEGVLGAQREGG